MAYATAAELRSYTGKTGTTQDAIIAEILEAASNAIDQYCDRPDGFVADSAASARIYPGSGLDYQFIDECIEITLVAVKDSPSDDTYTSWATTDWIAFRGEPKWPEFNRLPYHAVMIEAAGDYSIFTSGKYIVRAGFARTGESVRRVPTVQITARWGYAEEVPDQVKTATIAQASRWFKRFGGSFDDTIVSAELGSMAFKLRGTPIDNDIKAMLTRLKRPKVA